MCMYNRCGCVWVWVCVDSHMRWYSRYSSYTLFFFLTLSQEQEVDIRRQQIEAEQRANAEREKELEAARARTRNAATGAQQPAKPVSGPLHFFISVSFFPPHF